MNDLMLPPQAVEAEQSILGSLMLNNNLIDEVTAIVRPDHFYRIDHQMIFDAITDLDSKGESVDVLTVNEYLTEQNLIDRVGGLSYLGTMAKNTPNSGNVKTYAKIVKEKAQLRKLIELSNEIIENSYKPEGKTSDDILAIADTGFNSILQSSSNLDSRHIKDYLSGALDSLETRFNSGGEMVGIPTGFKEIDKTLLGLENGEVYVIAARPAMGKTAFALNIAKHQGLNGNCLFISMEMPIAQLINRLWASFGVDHGRIRSGKLLNDDWSRITNATSQLAQSGLYVDETPALSVSRIASIAKKRIKESGKMPIILDYLQIMDSDHKGGSRYEQVTSFSMGLKALSKTLDVPIVLLSQLSRNLENRQDKRPVMSDLRESGAIEQDAGSIMFLYRDEVYDKQTEHKGFAEVIISKNRNGECKTITLDWNGALQRFDDVTAQRFAEFARASSNNNAKGFS